MSFVYEIANLLQSAGVGQIGTSIFISTAAVIPAGNGPYMTLIATGGSGGAQTQNNTATERPTLQLKVRAKFYTNAETMLRAAYTALGGDNGLHNTVLGTIAYLRIVARQGLTDTGQDEVGRATVSFNIEAEKQPS